MKNIFLAAVCVLIMASAYWFLQGRGDSKSEVLLGTWSETRTDAAAEVDPTEPDSSVAPIDPTHTEQTEAPNNLNIDDIGNSLLFELEAQGQIPLFIESTFPGLGREYSRLTVSLEINPSPEAFTDLVDLAVMLVDEHWLGESPADAHAAAKAILNHLNSVHVDSGDEEVMALEAARLRVALHRLERIWGGRLAHVPPFRPSQGVRLYEELLALEHTDPALELRYQTLLFEAEPVLTGTFTTTMPLESVLASTRLEQTGGADQTLIRSHALLVKALLLNQKEPEVLASRLNLELEAVIGVTELREKVETGEVRLSKVKRERLNRLLARAQDAHRSTQDTARELITGFGSGS